MSDYPPLESMVRELWDREQIRDLKYRNLRLLDLKDWEAMAQTFAPDATTSWVNGTICLSGRDAIMGFLRSTDFARGDLVTHVHQCSAMEIGFTGPGRARSVSRLYNPMHNREVDNGYLLLSFYHDEFVRRDGTWSISHSGHQHLMEEVLDWRDVPSHRWLYRRSV